MGHNYVNRRYGNLAELAENISAEATVESSPTLTSEDTIDHLEENLTTDTIFNEYEENESVESFKSNEEYYPTDLDKSNSPHLPIYFKALGVFPLLTEEEELTLAKQIKEREHLYINLVIKWKNLFKNGIYQKLPQKHKKEITVLLKSLNGHSHLFDDLITMEKSRKRVARRLTGATATQEEVLSGELYKVETALSKCVAKISHHETIDSRVIWNLKKISYRQKSKKNRQFIEQELIGILNEIDNASEEIRNLKNRLAKANLRLVIYIAKKYSQHGVALSDLIQEGNLGLMRAIDTYDYRRGNRFVTYASWWIRQAMLRALDCQLRTIRTPVYINEKFNYIAKVSKRLEQKNKRKPTLEEIAEETKVPLASLERVLRSFNDAVSLDTLIEDQGEGGINPSLNYDKDTISEHVNSAQLSHTVEAMLSDLLTPREREIVKLRFGIGEKYDHTLEEMGRRFSISRERARQILETALSKLRNKININRLKEFIE